MTLKEQDAAYARDFNSTKIQSTWAICRDPVLLTIVGGAIDTIGFIALFGFYCSCDGQLGIGRGCVGEGVQVYGLNLRLFHCLL